ncbi:Endocuticle structural protein SgAbd-6 [Pseudolycoriella hygida]|uniref:Endocuticle structural protein SgAbd-6 n=1 Tax=Pseudolycoriella hygida TaxID=35572 RepID=A0A9Q0MLC3_9DIPT|nr:Endocuticle structural protein SgAbd-6 [Pseudolycoriella hygida]
MKLIILVVYAFILAIGILSTQAAPLDDSRDAQVLKYEYDNSGLGGYNFAYETSDGVSRSEQGEIKNAGTESEAIVITGTITWVAPDGQTFTIKFIADENGFQPQGDHIPKK